MKTIISDLQKQFDNAELKADITTLQALIADDFLSVGPKGFVLDKAQWIGRHTQFRYLQMEISAVDIRLYNNAAIVQNIQRNSATYNNQEVNLTTRVTQVWIMIADHWQLASIQFSPITDTATSAVS